MPRQSATAPIPNDVSEPKPSRKRPAEPWLFEIAWEVCNQVGGIYQVIRSKAPAMTARWDNRYFLVGPYHEQAASVEFEQIAPTGTVAKAIHDLEELGIRAYFGRWLVTGRPQVILLDYLPIFAHLHEIKFRLWNDHGIELPPDDELLNNVCAFGEVVRMFLSILAHRENPRRHLVAHFHEYMSAAAVPMLRKEGWPGSIVFTTHATLLGRYLAMNSDDFYTRLPFYNDAEEAKRFNVKAQHGLERAAAHGSHVFTTVSDVTGDECLHLLGRKPDILLPNGLNIQRFTAIHEFQNLHRVYKEKIHEFTMGHFFPSYRFDLDNTLYFFTSGRFEYRNKGMDITIESLARLNHRLRSAGSNMTVVAFIVTRRPFHSMSVTALQSHAMLDEIRTIADAIKDDIGDKLFHAAATGQIGDLNTMVDEYWRLRLRRTIQTWRRTSPPGVVTHDLVDVQNDPVLNDLRRCRLLNEPHDPVKVIYHPDFISNTNPLFGIEYDQFVRGCHLGVFPSYYEPWGYTPLESIASGVPAITSDLAGFGSYVQRMQQAQEQHPTRRRREDAQGLTVLQRRYRSYHESADDLADIMFRYCELSRRDRVSVRNQVELLSTQFDWTNLAERYDAAHQMAIDAVG